MISMCQCICHYKNQGGSKKCSTGQKTQKAEPETICSRLLVCGLVIKPFVNHSLNKKVFSSPSFSTKSNLTVLSDDPLQQPFWMEN